ncbi:hypothetical protein [Bradyrhizobium sp. CCBAU 11361]|uniref:hypothetical protein n=1 Tax=Bradyrhizobium sp. CCBAU 11361 TaxID=1630812 RepID=UPI0023025FCA|nr:hypothetical protein [Bradyrhizobium sp. CCBAU 11361]
MALSRESGLSLRQAYRYLEVAKRKEPVLPHRSRLWCSEDANPSCSKTSGACGGFQTSVSEVMRQSVAAYLALIREDG